MQSLTLVSFFRFYFIICKNAVAKACFKLNLSCQNYENILDLSEDI